MVGTFEQFVYDHYIAGVRQGMQGLMGKPYVLFYPHADVRRVIDAMKRILKRVGTQVGEPVG